MDNQLQKVENTGLAIRTPLLYYPELNDTDVKESGVLDTLQKKVVLATLNHPKIKTLNIVKGEPGQRNTEPYDALVEIIGLAIWTMGITENSMTKLEQKLFIPVAIEEIKTFENLTIEDVRIAFNRGSRRKYGDFFAMTITAVNIWLTKYEEETKLDAMMRLKFVKKKELPAPELTEEEKQKNHNDWIEGVYKHFDEQLRTNEYTFYDFGNKFYVYLKKLGLIALSPEQQQNIWNMAVDELKKEYHPKNGRNFGQRVDLKAIYDGLKLDEVGKREENLIIARAKKITIRWYFIKLIRNKQHIKGEVEAAEKNMLDKPKT
jgi:hypothetical protein